MEPMDAQAIFVRDLIILRILEEKPVDKDTVINVV
jgi:hypothetical protein